MFIEALEWLPVLFSHIEINTLTLQTKNFHAQASVQYRDNRFFINSDAFFLYSSIITHEKTRIKANPVLYLKNSGLFLDTYLDYDLLANKARGKSSFQWHDANGTLDFQRDGDLIALQANSQQFSQLEPIFKSFKLHEKINAWTYEKITAASYRLKELRFRHDLSKDLDLYNLSGHAVARKGRIKFHENLPPVRSSRIDLRFEKGRLLFDLQDPTYEDKSLEGSSVAISDLLDDKSDFIDINIQTKSRYDTKIEKLLAAYGIDILIKQQKGEVDASLDLRIAFANGRVSTEGSFKAHDARFSLFSYPLAAKKAAVRLKNNTVFLDNIHIRDATKEFFADGVIDTKEKTATLQTKVKKYRKYFFDAENKNFTASIDFGTKQTAIAIDDFHTSMKVSGEHFALHIDDLSAVEPLLQYPYSKDINITKGELKATSDDYDVFDFQADFEASQPFLYKKNKLTRFLVQGKAHTDKDQITFDINNNIQYNHKDKLLRVQDTGFDITTLLRKTDVEDLQKIQRQLSVAAKNSPVAINGHELQSDSYTFTLQPDSMLLLSRHKGSNIQFRMTPKYLHFSGDNLSDATLHPLLNNTSLQKGRYAFNIEGDIDNLNGDITVKGGTLTDMKAYNNLIALVNTLPALAVFKNPGFNKEGLSIEKGKITFTTQGNLVNIEKLDIEGKSADIEGNGFIALENDMIDMNIKVKTIKDLGKLASNIPLAGYIIFGDDKSLTFKAKIQGPLKDPKVTTNTAGKIIQTPLGLIKRTIESPFKLIYDLFD